MKSTVTPSFLRRIRTFDALRYHASFRYLWSSYLLWQVGIWAQLLVMNWLAYKMTNSPFLVAVFAAVRISPLLLGPFVGVMADRFDRKKLLLGLQVLQVVFAAAVAVLLASGAFQFWHLLVFGFLDGFLWNMYYMTDYVLSVDIVGSDNVTNVVALNSLAAYFTGVVGPTLGGFLVDIVGPANCFWIGSGMAALSACVMLPMKVAKRGGVTAHPSVRHELTEGFRYVTGNRVLLSIFAVSLAANLFIWPANQSFVPVFARDNLGQGPLGLGFLFTAAAAGSFVGSAIIASAGNFGKRGLLFLSGTAFFGLFFGLFALTRSFPLALTLSALGGLASCAFDTMQSTLTLTSAPEEMRARSLGFLTMAIGILPFGCLAVGAIAGVAGAGVTTAVSSLLLVVTIVMIAFKLPGLRRLP